MGLVGRVVCSVGVALLLVLAAAGPAAAEDIPACRFTVEVLPRPTYYDRMLDLAAAGPVPDAREMFGPQFAFFWGQSRDLGWYVGLAPGPLDLDAARAYLLARVDAHYSGSDAELLRERLHVVSQPYGELELRAVQKELADELVRANWGVGWMLSAGSCDYSDARRVELELFNDSSDSVLHAARQLAARWGDRVVVVRVAGGPPRPRVGRLPLMNPPDRKPDRRIRLSDLLVTRPCVRGPRALLRVKRSALPKVDRLMVTARGRRTVFRGRRLRHPLRIRLRHRTRTIRIAVGLRDGTTVSATRRLRSCRPT